MLAKISILPIGTRIRVLNLPKMSDDPWHLRRKAFKGEIGTVVSTRKLRFDNLIEWLPGQKEREFICLEPIEFCRLDDPDENY